MPQPIEPPFQWPFAAPEAPRGCALRFGDAEPLLLDCGRTLSPFTVAYMTYGKLNAQRSNTVLVCHALSGDQFAAGIHPVTGRAGWWSTMVGPGKPIDTDRYFVICTNVIGGCMGSSGPANLNPATGRPFGLDFPIVTIRDMVNAQALLLDALNIERLLCVTGGSMGGMQVLQWVTSFPDRVLSAIPIASAAAHTAQNIALHEVGRQAIMADPNWHGGNYALESVQPAKGMAIARMVGHISYLSEAALTRKFGRALNGRPALSFGFEQDFQVESYLHHQGGSFVERFDANSYLYITRAMDYFDIGAEFGGDLKCAFAETAARFLVISFISDWLFPTAQNRMIADAASAAGAYVEFREIASDKGHDAFLLEEPELFTAVRGFLNSIEEEKRLG